MFVRSLLRLALALCIGALGGWIFLHFRLPLPWMLGSLAFTLVAALLGVPMRAPKEVRPFMTAVLGVLLGSSFSTGMIDQALSWGFSLLMLVPYIALTGLVGVPYFTRIAGYDRITAYFSAMPGGLNEMVYVGAQMGGDERLISLTHAGRILVAVFTLPLAFNFFMHLDPAQRARFAVSIFDVPWQQQLILIACAVGWPLAVRLKLPAPMLLGPMLVSAGVHMAGFSHAKPPDEIVALAQLVIGTALGCRFAGTPVRLVLTALMHSAGMVALMLLLTLGFAFALEPLLNVRLAGIILAFAPGGLAEMTLIALSLGIDVAYVALHHLVRILLVIIGAARVGRWLIRHEHAPKGD
jgi:uncharacterized protein